MKPTLLLPLLVVSLALAAVPAAAYNPPTDVAGPLSVRIEGPDEVAPAALPDPLKHVREELDRAIQEERYEDAVRLRDELRRLENPPPPPLPPMAN